MGTELAWGGFREACGGLFFIRAELLLSLPKLSVWLPRPELALTGALSCPPELRRGGAEPLPASQGSSCLRGLPPLPEAFLLLPKPLSPQ